MSARERILGKLRAASRPFEDVPPVGDRRVMSPLEPAGAAAMFVERLKALSAQVLVTADERQAVDYVLGVVGDDAQVLAWDFAEIPLAGLAAALSARGVRVADPHASDVRVGITGVDAALGATGSLVVSARPGRARTVSLLPHVHIAVVRAAQVLPHMEAWIAQQSADVAAFRAVGNHIIISGASRTADIGMELVLGAHGPAELHVILLEP
jgi:L-lactate dehydrogenase complex protein LldG